MSVYRAAGEHELREGDLRPVRAGEQRICVARHAGVIYAINDVCSHEEASLSDGEIFDGAVQCPMHGSMFDLRTGAVTGLPAVQAVKTYAVTLKDGDVLVDVPESP
jgi:3-phenylpropionate/trans-cinnamate dioxygenase ferredoxin subunit